MAKTLRIIKTDFGADCDDQKAMSDIIAKTGFAGHIDDRKAVLDMIAAVKPDETLAFIVSGPHPDLAAAAIAEQYHAKTGGWPLLTLGQQFEEDKKSAREIYSLADGGSMADKTVDVPLLSQEDFQAALRGLIASGKIATVEQVIIAPLHSTYEYFNPASDAAKADADFQAAWATVQKTATLQFQRLEDGTCKGNNYQKSEPGIAEGFLDLLKQDGVNAVFFDGAVAKAPEFLMNVTQPTQPGLQRACESYMAAMQVPWLYMTQPIGVTPGAEHMHTGMFTAGAQFPFGVHLAAGTPAGFGAERALKEICGITRAETAKYDAAMAPINAELDRFDAAVLAKLQEKHPEIDSVATMRAEMHRGMLAALLSFAQKKGVAAEGEMIETFTGLFAAAKEKGIKLNPYNYMGEYSQELYAQSPLTKEITEIAAAEAGREFNGKTHTQIMAGALSAHGARAIIYDAVCVAAGDLVRGNASLAAHFNNSAFPNVINITAERIAKLKEQDAPLYAAFAEDIRKALTLDGAVLAVGAAPASPKAKPSLA